MLKALVAAIRRREIWIDGAAKWRNPEDDLPVDFEANRHVHYAAIRAPLDGQEFVDDLKQRLGAASDMFNGALVGKALAAADALAVADDELHTGVAPDASIGVLVPGEIGIGRVRRW